MDVDLVIGYQGKSKIVSGYSLNAQEVSIISDEKDLDNIIAHVTTLLKG